jgi:hypothetical protein
MRTPQALLAAISTAAVALVIAASFTVMGSPAEQRRQRLDDVRVTHVERLAEAINRYYGRHQRLPVSLEETEHDQGESATLRDPVTQARYEYRIDGPRAYSICAHFDRPDLPIGDAPDLWSHQAGRQCFARGPR